MKAKPESAAPSPVTITRSYGGRLLVSMLTIEPDADGWVWLENQSELTLAATGELLGSGLSLPPGARRRLLVATDSTCERAVLLYELEADDEGEPVCARINVRPRR